MFGLKIYIQRYAEAWYIATGRDKQGRFLWGAGRTHLEALLEAIKS